MKVTTIFVHAVENSDGTVKTFHSGHESGPTIDRFIDNAAINGFTKYCGIIGTRQTTFKPMRIA